MEELRPHLERWRARGERVAVATVVATRSSSPRSVGSKLLVSASGELAGSVSGGCVENDVVLAAQDVLAGAPPRLVTYGISDEMAFGVGLPCGGEIDVFVEELRQGEEEPGDITLTVIGGEGVGDKLRDPQLEEAARRRSRSHVIQLEDRTVFADLELPQSRLLVYGAVDTAEALCRLAKGLGWRTVVADARPRFATPERIPSADELLVLWPEETLAHVQPDAATAIVVLTHDDKFDLPLLEGALRTDAPYIGIIGSRRNQERRRGVLREHGMTDDELARIVGPAGLDLGADTPAETALSILAEILAVRAGREGGRLREGTSRIHAEPVPAGFDKK